MLSDQRAARLDALSASMIGLAKLIQTRKEPAGTIHVITILDAKLPDEMIFFSWYHHRGNENDCEDGHGHREPVRS